jgi:hypothetical protein
MFKNNSLLSDVYHGFDVTLEYCVWNPYRIFRLYYFCTTRPRHVGKDNLKMGFQEPGGGWAWSGLIWLGICVDGRLL